MNRGPANKALLDVKQQLKKMKLDFSIQLFSSLNKQGLEELASVMGGRLNFTLEQSAEFDLALIPEAEADDLAEDSLEDDESDAFEVEEFEVDALEQAPKQD
jgi:GTP-binding protein